MEKENSIFLVTGGAGFIGSHIVDLLLSAGHRVRVIDNLSGGREENLQQHKNNHNLVCEWKDINSLELNPNHSNLFKDVNYVIHMAGIGDIAPSIEKPYDYMNTNVLGTIKLLENICHYAPNIKKVVYAASSSCYGLAETPTDENHLIQPQYPYALSKYQGEQACLHWHRVYKIPVNSIRIFNAYGPRVKTTGAYGAVFGVFFKQKLSGKPFTVVGDGTQKRDFLYVTDVAKAFVLAAKTELEGQIWNLGAGQPHTVNELVDIIGGQVTYIPKRPGEPDCTWANISKITRDLKWKAEVSFEQGVQNMLQNLKTWQDAPLWEPDSIARATKIWFEYLN